MRARASILVLAIALAACGASARQHAIQTTFLAVNAAESGFVAFDAQHQLDIANTAPDKVTGEKQLADWRAKRAKVVKAIAGAYRAIATAATINDDHSLAAMVQAALIVKSELADLGVKL